MEATLIEELENDFLKLRDAGKRQACLGSLATCEANGQPRVRTVLLHDISKGTVLFMVSSLHQKWKQLSENPKAELLIWWPELGLQYRLCGYCEALSKGKERERWLELPAGARQLDWAYGDGFLPGSPVESYQTMKAEVIHRSASLSLEEPPEHVRALQLSIVEAERLAISPADRMHDRRLTKMSDGEWIEVQLVP